MNTGFDTHHGLIVVPARVFGPRGDRIVRMALDTGATTTTLRTAILVRLGYVPGAVEDRVRMTTASGIEYVPRVSVERIESLGEYRRSFPVIAHTLPPSAVVDGLIGLDYVRERRLLIDFRQGIVNLE